MEGTQSLIIDEETAPELGAKELGTILNINDLTVCC